MLVSRSALADVRSGFSDGIVDRIDRVRASPIPGWFVHVIRNAVIDLKYGPPLALASIVHHEHSNTDYEVLGVIFDGRIRDEDVLVDVGSGAGRVINQWLGSGHQGPIHGLELDRWLARWSAHRLQRHPNVSIVRGDAAEHLPAEGTVFYLFNPFDRDTMARFADAITGLPGDRDRLILYFNCKHVGVFEERARFGPVHIERVEHPRAQGQQLAVIALPSSSKPADGDRN